MDLLIKYLDKYFRRITKVGFALKIDNLPDEYILKDKVIKWEKRFWEKEIEKDVYLNCIDTTFALYKPKYPLIFSNIKYLHALRIGGDYLAKHGGWYINSSNLTTEQEFYFKTVNSSSSWRLNSEGKHDSNEYDFFCENSIN